MKSAMIIASLNADAQGNGKRRNNRQGGKKSDRRENEKSTSEASPVKQNSASAKIFESVKIEIAKPTLVASPIEQVPATPEVLEIVKVVVAGPTLVGIQAPATPKAVEKTITAEIAVPTPVASQVEEVPTTPKVPEIAKPTCVASQAAKAPITPKASEILKVEIAAPASTSNADVELGKKRRNKRRRGKKSSLGGNKAPDSGVGTATVTPVESSGRQLPAIPKALEIIKGETATPAPVASLIAKVLATPKAEPAPPAPVASLIAKVQASPKVETATTPTSMASPHAKVAASSKVVEAIKVEIAAPVSAPNEDAECNSKRRNKRHGGKKPNRRGKKKVNAMASSMKEAPGTPKVVETTKVETATPTTLANPVTERAATSNVLDETTNEVPDASKKGSV